MNNKAKITILILFILAMIGLNYYLYHHPGNELFEIFNTSNQSTNPSFYAPEVQNNQVTVNTLPSSQAVSSCPQLIEPTNFSFNNQFGLSLKGDFLKKYLKPQK